MNSENLVISPRIIFGIFLISCLDTIYVQSTFLHKTNILANVQKPGTGISIGENIGAAVDHKVNHILGLSKGSQVSGNGQGRGQAQNNAQVTMVLNNHNYNVPVHGQAGLQDYGQSYGQAGAQAKAETNVNTNNHFNMQHSPSLPQPPPQNFNPSYGSSGGATASSSASAGTQNQGDYKYQVKVPYVQLPPSQHFEHPLPPPLSQVHSGPPQGGSNAEASAIAQAKAETNVNTNNHFNMQPSLPQPPPQNFNPSYGSSGGATASSSASAGTQNQGDYKYQVKVPYVQLPPSQHFEHPLPPPLPSNLPHGGSTAEASASASSHAYDGNVAPVYVKPRPPYPGPLSPPQVHSGLPQGGSNSEASAIASIQAHGGLSSQSLPPIANGPYTGSAGISGASASAQSHAGANAVPVVPLTPCSQVQQPGVGLVTDIQPAIDIRSSHVAKREISAGTTPLGLNLESKESLKASLNSGNLSSISASLGVPHVNPQLPLEVSVNGEKPKVPIITTDTSIMSAIPEEKASIVPPAVSSEIQANSVNESVGAGLETSVTSSNLLSNVEPPKVDSKILGSGQSFTFNAGLKSGTDNSGIKIPGPPQKSSFLTAEIKTPIIDASILKQ